MYSGGSHEKYLQNEREWRSCRLAVVGADQDMEDDLLKAMRVFTSMYEINSGQDAMYALKKMKNDLLAEALAAFLQAMNAYRQRHSDEF